MEKTIADLRPALMPVSRIPSAGPRDTLDKAFSSLQSSHESVFVFDATGGFLGLACPARSLFKTRATYQTSAASVLFQPPRITSGTPVSDIARFMLATRCYTLPVEGKDGAVRGAVTARTLLKALLREEDYLRILAESVVPERPVTLARNASGTSVYAHLRKGEVTRILLVSENGRLEGLVSRRDIQSHLTKPTSRQRIRGGGKGPFRDFIMGVKKTSRLEFPALSMASRNILAVPEKTPTGDILATLLRSRRNSIVLLDRDSRPTGIVSLRTILKAVSAQDANETAPLSVTNGARLPDGDVAYVRNRARTLVEKLQTRLPVLRSRVSLKAPHNAAGRPLMFEVVLEVIPVSGEPFVARGDDRDLLRALAQAERRIERQVKDRS